MGYPVTVHGLGRGRGQVQVFGLQVCRVGGLVDRKSYQTPPCLALHPVRFIRYCPGPPLPRKAKTEAEDLGIVEVGLVDGPGKIQGDRRRPHRRYRDS